MARTIQSPGVEIREVDFTIRPVTVAGTSVFLPGFSDQGPIDEVLQPGSLSEFTQIYGEPTNSAERYFHHTAKAILTQSPARLVTTRLPYGAGKGDAFDNWKYSALVFPVRGAKTTNTPQGAVSVYSISTINVSVPGTGYLSAGPTITTSTAAASATVIPAVLKPLMSATVVGSVTGVEVVSTGVYTTSSINLIFNPNGSTGSIVVPSVAVNTTETVTPSSNYTTTSTNLEDANVYFFGTPTHIELNADQYSNILENNIDWTTDPIVTSKNQVFTSDTLGSAGLIVLNKAQTSLNNAFEGYYVGAIDNNNYNPATPFNGANYVKAIQSSVQSINNYIDVPPARLNFALSATKFGDGGSVSEVLENLSQNDLNGRAFDDTVSFGLFKLRKSIFTPDTLSLDYTLAEGYVGSLDYHRQVADQNGGPSKTYYIGAISENSNNAVVMVNPYISNQYSNTWVTSAGNPGKKVRFLSPQLTAKLDSSGYIDTNDAYVERVGATQDYVTMVYNNLGSTDALFALGVYTNTVLSDKSIGNLPSKLERAFELVENVDLYQINIAVEGGLGTVYVNSQRQINNTYQDSKPLNSLSALYVTNPEGLTQEGQSIRSDYTAVANAFLIPAEKQRKDFIVILDPIRNILVQGANSKNAAAKQLYSPNAGEGSDPSAPGFVTSNFSQHIFWPMRHQFSMLNSSYAAVYAGWAQVVDTFTNRQTWAPFSGFAAAVMANTDQNFQPWIAPAGFTRGTVVGVSDVGVFPKQKQRDQLYKIGINPVAFFPAEGFVLFGQKTLLKKPSAFDRINVRRLFLSLESSVRDTIKFFVFEPNTLFTRTQIVNTLSPIFDNAKNTEGLFDYLIVCDERNNTPDVIDNNELKVDIYIKPVRTAEFILVTFYATRTNQNFQELIGG